MGDIPSQKSKKRNNNLSGSQSKKMSLQAKRIERMRAFVDRSDMQNLFHGNNHGGANANVIESNPLYSNFVKETGNDELDDEKTRFIKETEDSMDDADVDDNRIAIGQIIGRNIASGSADIVGQSYLKTKKADIEESLSEEEDDGND